jgi:nicotinamide-nucleotide amidase
VDQGFLAVLRDEWIAVATALGERCVKNGMTITGAESCTGGLIAAAMTSVAGSSAWFDRGFVTYSNEAKIQMLKVSEETLHAHGAVSEETAREMARGALKHSKATHSFSVTGVAGPTGGTVDKPVGMVCFGFAARDSVAVRASTLHFAGDRAAVREQSVGYVLAQLLAA